MKRTLRSLLSMVMVLSMILSMVLVSGLTASAATKVYLTGEEAFQPGAVTDGYVITPDAEGNGFTVSSSVGLAATGYAGVLSAPNTSGLQYFVLVVDSFAGAWSIDNVAPGWQTTTGTYVFEANGTTTEGVLWLYPGLSNSFHVKEMYYSDVDPTAVEGDLFVPVSSLNWGYNNATITPTGDDGLGVNLVGSGDVYTYWNFTLTQIKQTPYLVVDFADDDTLANMWPAQYCSITYGYAGTELQTLRYAGRQVIDLSKLATDNNLCITLRSYASINFDALYLTNVPEVTKYHVKYISPAAGAANVTPTNSGDYGLTYTVPENAEGDQYCYYNTLPKARYLVYKLKEGSPTSRMVIAANTWWTGAVDLPAPSTTRTVIDITTLPCYSASNTMLLQNLFTATTEFEEFYFVDEGVTPTHNFFSFETNGGTAVPAGIVPVGVPFMTPTKEGYAFGGWYTDAALTQAFDINAANTAPTTLYAKWVIDGDISPVSAQLQVGVTAESESAAIRFVAVLDSREFAEAGFVFSRSNATPTVGDASSMAVTTDTVWTSINAAGSTVTAAELHGSYIFACTVNGIGNANFDADIYVRAYVKGFDGNYTYTDVKTYSVNGMLG